MAVPKSLVFHLHKYWEVIESLVRFSRELPAFEEPDVLRLITKQQGYTKGQEAESAAVMRALCNADVLQYLSRSSNLQLNPLVLNFVRGLTREHELGLSAVLKARVDAMLLATEQLKKGLADTDIDLLRRGAAHLSELFRQISLQLDQDRHAILELAEKAKSQDASIPIAKRYQTVLETYDQYVEPMNEMMDSGANGTFYPYLTDAEQTLDAASEYLSIQGGLYSHRLQLRQVAYQAKELRHVGRIVAHQCADTLLPLREEARAHNELSAAISHLLGRVRKRGLRRALKVADKSENPEPKLPHWQRGRRSRVNLGDEVLDIMAQAQNFLPSTESFPEELPADPSTMPIRIDEQALRTALSAALPIDNLMIWLCAEYPTIPDDLILRLYQDLVREPLWRAQLQDCEVETELNELKVSYYPHQLQAEENEIL